MRKLLLLILLLIPTTLYAQGSASTLDPTTLVTQTSGVFKFIAREVPPGAPTAALAGGGAGNVNNGTHRYKITFVTAQGQTSGGTASVIVTVTDKTADGKVALSSIPTGSPFVTSRKIYRTLAGGTTYKLLTTLADNTTTIYTDNTSDASLTTTLPAPNTTANNFFQYANTGGVVTIPKLSAIFNGYAISALPSPVVGMQAYITDGDAGLTWGATAVNTGAGATTYLVWYNGTNWTVIGK